MRARVEEKAQRIKERKWQMATTISMALCTLTVVLCLLGGWALVEAACSSRDSHTSTSSSSSSNSNSLPPSSSPLPSLPEECPQLSQQEMQTSYIQCFANAQFKMSINVAVDDYGVLTSRANQVLDGNEFVSSFDELVSENCLTDSLQPKNKYWKYVCDYNANQIPQTSWSVECHQDYNPCREKMVTCTCNHNNQGISETSVCSDGVPRTLDCTGACLEEEETCQATYSIQQEWTEVNVTTMFLELDGGEEFITSCKATPMEVYLSNKWRLGHRKVTVACTCEEQEPVRVLSE